MGFTLMQGNSREKKRNELTHNNCASRNKFCQNPQKNGEDLSLPLMALQPSNCGTRLMPLSYFLHEMYISLCVCVYIQRACVVHLSVHEELSYQSSDCIIVAANLPIGTMEDRTPNKPSFFSIFKMAFFSSMTKTPGRLP